MAVRTSTVTCRYSAAKYPARSPTRLVSRTIPAGQVTTSSICGRPEAPPVASGGTLLSGGLRRQSRRGGDAGLHGPAEALPQREPASLAATSTVPNAAVTVSTSTSSIPSDTSEPQNGASVCMTSTITVHNRPRHRPTRTSGGVTSGCGRYHVLSRDRCDWLWGCCGVSLRRVRADGLEGDWAGAGERPVPGGVGQWAAPSSTHRTPMTMRRMPAPMTLVRGSRKRTREATAVRATPAAAQMP